MHTYRESSKLKYKFTKQLFKTAWNDGDLQETQVSYRQTPNGNKGCHWQLHMKTKYIFNRTSNLKSWK